MLHRTIEGRLEEIENELHDIKKMLFQFLTSKKEKQPEFKGATYMSVKDVAAYAGVDTPVVYTACKKQQIKFIKIGKLYKFKNEDVLKWLNGEKDSLNATEEGVDDFVNRYLQNNILRG